MMGPGRSQQMQLTVNPRTVGTLSQAGDVVVSSESSHAMTDDRLNLRPQGKRKTGTGLSYLARPRRRVRL